MKEVEEEGKRQREKGMRRRGRKWRGAEYIRSDPGRFAHTKKRTDRTDSSLLLEESFRH